MGMAAFLVPEIEIWAAHGVIFIKMQRLPEKGPAPL